MILRSEQIVKYGDGSMKKLEELGEVPEPILFPDTQVEVESGEPTMDLEDYIEDIASDVGSKYSETVLFFNEHVSDGGNPAEIDLSDDYTNYDALYIDVVRVADQTLYQIPGTILVSVLANDSKFQFISDGKYVSYGVTNSKKFTRINVSASQNVVIRSIIGIKF